MQEKPILFSTPMVQANLDDRKTNTRRTRGLEKINEDPDSVEFVRFQEYKDGSYRAIFQHKLADEPGSVKCPYGKQGDLLWVRESFQNILRESGQHQNIFKADPIIWQGKWKPSIHMPKATARIWLQVEEIKVERLNKISALDAISEGIKNLSLTAWKDYLVNERYCSNPVQSFKSLFLSINAKPSPNRERANYGTILSYTAIAWDQDDFDKNWAKYDGIYRGKPLSVTINPWVWVVKFKTLSTTGKP